MPAQPIGSRRWTDPDWQREARGWVEDRLGNLGGSLAGEPEQVHVRPWSTAIRYPTSQGVVWFKADAVGSAHEVPLVAALARWAPDHVLSPLAEDASRGWLLLPDGGSTLRAAQGGETDIAHWTEILLDHAELQRRVAPHSGELIDLGVPDLRPQQLPRLRAELLGDPVALRMGLEGGLTEDQHRRLTQDAPDYERWCAALAAIGVPASINHDDLHDNNVFVPAQPDGHYRVFDWGDATVAHPFAVLLVSLRVVANMHELPYGDAALLRLRDAYLEPWTAEFDRASLVEAVRLALRVGVVSRARSYREALREGTPDDHAEHGDGVPGWLMESYAPTPVEPGFADQAG